MAAYLAGRDGRPRDAVAVGATVTLTHTGGVLVLGLVLTSVTGLFGVRVLGALGIVSGALIVVVGAALLRRALRATRTHIPDHAHDHGDTHDADHGRHNHGHHHGQGMPVDTTTGVHTTTGTTAMTTTTVMCTGTGTTMGTGLGVGGPTGGAFSGWGWRAGWCPARRR
ncbi:hypothetical protein ACFQX7_26350 [Luedemannella flava]